ncbi:hypothetical protein V6N13_093192 [Hibiscus sabdariffa]
MMAQRDVCMSFQHKKCSVSSPQQRSIFAPVPSGEQMSQIHKASGDDVRKRRMIGVVEDEKLEILRSCAIWVVAFEEAIGQHCDCCCGTDVESRMNNEAKVPSGKVEKPLEVQAEGDSSRVNGHLVDASMEGSVVPNTVSLEVDLASQIDRMWEGNMREDWRVGMYCQCLKLVE